MKHSKYIFGFFLAINLIADQQISFGYTVNLPSKTVYTDGSFNDTTNGAAYALGQNVDGWTIDVGTNGNTYYWSNSLTPINLNFSNNITFCGGTLSTNWPSTNSPHIVTYSGNGIPIWFNQKVPGKTVTVYGFYFPEWNTNSSQALIEFSGIGVNVFNIFGCYFHHFNGSGDTIWTATPEGGLNGNGPWGVIHSNIVDSAGGGPGQFAFIHENTTTTSSAWVRDGMTFGSISNVFIEYNTFFASTFINGSSAVDSDDGARFVFRNNTLTNFPVNNHGADEDSTKTNSTLECEIMHNLITGTLNGGVIGDAAVRIRGGSAIVFDNTLIGAGGSPDFNSFTSLNFYRATTGLIPSGIIDRHYSCACATNGTSDYLGTQQPGSGVILSASGQDPVFPSMHWVSVPIYFTNNHISASIFNYVASDTGSTFVQNNRDYFTNSLPVGYAEFANPYSALTDPTISIQPQNQTVTAPATATFSVTASGQSALSYQWSKNGTQIPGATQVSYTTPATSYPSDNGSTFYVVVTDLAGSIQSGTATLTVTPNPGASLTVNGINANVGSFKSAY